MRILGIVILSPELAEGRRISLFGLALAIGGLLAWNPAAAAKAKTEDARPKKAFVSIDEVDPGIVVEARYFGTHNFIGKPIRGYTASKCLLTKEAAQALAAVQADLKPFGLSLKVYDCYRPQQGVDHFVEWAKDLADQKMKKEFYPAVDKAVLFDEGYIAKRSGHSRGSTLDLTIVPVPTPPQAAWTDGQSLVDCTRPAGRRYKDNSVDMGTGYDCFSPRSHTANPAIGVAPKMHRLVLKTAMEKHGFTNYEKEWWHFTLKDEPFPKRFFNFPVE